MNMRTIADFEEKLIDFLWDKFEKDSTIKSIIKDKNQIVLNSPIDEMKGGLSLFLYQINENIFLRNQNFQETNPKTIQSSPLFLSLFYLITPTTDNPFNDHILLSKILQLIHDNSQLKLSFKDGTNDFTNERFNLIMNDLTIDEMNKIWSILSSSKPYKLSISLEVTPIKIESSKSTEFKEVEEVEFKYYLR